MPSVSTVLAYHRFGFGPRPGDLDKPGAGSIEALLAEVTYKPEPSPFMGLLKSNDLLERLADFLGERRAAREEVKAQAAGQAGAQNAAPSSPGSPAVPGVVATRPAVSAPAASATQVGTGAQPQALPQPGTPPAPMMQNPVPAFVLDEHTARVRAAVTAPIGFQERLALFWANHFTVAGINPRVRVTCGAFEREAIRPHVAGRFEDMLMAAESHPAMLIYLDNAQSIGPNSLAGQRQRRGLNENLAREILELHTLGVDGGYSQEDVTRFAQIITGWSVTRGNGQDGPPGLFMFRENTHEPGPRRMLGRDYNQWGVEQGRAVLRDLAAHPSTARHIATKLCRHFIADTPPADAVKRVEAAFKSSGGRLMAVYEALLKSPEAWEPAPAKLRTPYEYVIAIMRALDIEPDIRAVTRSLQLLGHMPFQASSPKGWPEEASAWIAPDAIKTRLDLAEISARRAARSQPLELAGAMLGPLLTDETRTAIRRAESTHQAVALLLMSPEFQRR